MPLTTPITSGGVNALRLSVIYENLKEWSEVWLDRLIPEAEVGSIYTAEHW